MCAMTNGADRTKMSIGSESRGNHPVMPARRGAARRGGGGEREQRSLRAPLHAITLHVVYIRLHSDCRIRYIEIFVAPQGSEHGILLILTLQCRVQHN